MKVFNYPHLFQNGIKLGDQMTIWPIYGQKKKVILKNIELEFISENNTPCNKRPSNLVVLPILKNQNFHYKLYLWANRNVENSRYLLKSLTKCPFYINGTYSLESFIEREDKICLGHNILKFNKLPEKSSSALDHPILENKKALNSNCNILLEGETGTGKTSLARQIHLQSDKSGPLVHVNLAAFSQNLIESELFGHVKGAFTGAVSEKKGALLEAQNGTLFLDEIDSLSKKIQTKLLLFFDSKKVRPVGGRSESSCNVRIILASGKPLDILMQKGEVRSDFFYRITSGIKITLEPLRNSFEKIKFLCLDQAIKEDLIIPSQLIEFYCSLPWPGNIRQLLSHISKKKIMSKSRKLEFDQYDEELLHLSNNLLKNNDDENGEIETIFPSLQDYKFNYVIKVFHHFKCNIKKTSKVLKISTNTLRTILKSKNIKTTDYNTLPRH